MQRSFLKFNQIGKILPVPPTVLLPIVEVDDRLHKHRRVRLLYTMPEFALNLPVLQLFDVICEFGHYLQSSLSITAVFRQIVGFPIEDLVHLHQFIRIFIGEATDHASLQIMLVDQSSGLLHAFQPSVQLELQLREILFQSIDAIVHQGRDRTVLMRIQPFQNGLSCVDYEVLYQSFSALRNLIDEGLGEFITIELVDSQPAFDCTLNIHCFGHSLHTLPDYFRFLHQAGSKRSLLYLRTRTSHVEIDLIVAVLLSKYSCFCQFLRIRPSQLKNDRMFVLVERQKMVVAVDDGVVMQHFGVESSPLGDETHEVAEVGVGDIDHRRDGEQTHRDDFDGQVVLHFFYNSTMKQGIYGERVQRYESFDFFRIRYLFTLLTLSPNPNPSSLKRHSITSSITVQMNDCQRLPANI